MNIKYAQKKYFRRAAHLGTVLHVFARKKVVKPVTIMMMINDGNDDDRANNDDYCPLMKTVSDYTVQFIPAVF